MASETERSSEHDDQEWVTIARFTTAHEAELARGVLEAGGVAVTVLDAEMVGVAWVLSNAIGGARIQVPKGSVEKANELLGEAAVVEDEEPQEAEEPPPASNALAKRALGAALLGFMFPILPNLYSLWILWQFSSSKGRASQAARVWCGVALFINALVALLIFAIVKQF